MYLARKKPLPALNLLTNPNNGAPMPKNNVSDANTDPKVHQQLVDQDTGEPRQFNVSRYQILTRLWEIGNMDPERTRNGMSAQVKAIAMIVAIEGLIPDRNSARRAVSAQNQPASPPIHPGFYKAAWLRQQEGENADPQPPSAHPQAQEEGIAPEFQSAPGTDDNPPPPTPNPGLSPSETASSPYPSATSWVPDSRTSFTVPKQPFGRRR
jgi:hypothetical protein